MTFFLILNMYRNFTEFRCLPLSLRLTSINYIEEFTNDHGYVPLVINTSRSFPHSWLITGFVTRLTRRLPLVEQGLLTLAEHLSSPPVFSEVRVTPSLVLYICFVDRCLSFCTCSSGHFVVCSSIYGFWLPLWYLQTLLKDTKEEIIISMSKKDRQHNGQKKNDKYIYYWSLEIFKSTFCFYFFFFLLRHIALLVASLVIASLSLVMINLREHLVSPPFLLELHVVWTSVVFDFMGVLDILCSRFVLLPKYSFELGYPSFIFKQKE
jgi:hypothetical protein